MNTVPIVTFNELEPAEQLRERLQRAGIPATIHDESKLERFGFMSEPFAAIHVKVPQARYLDACQLIGAWEPTDSALKEAVRCPECRSSRVEFPQLPRKFLSPALGSVLMALRIIPRKFYCVDCHCTWPTVVAMKRKLDLLGWPEDSRFWHPENRQRNQRA